jgi:hypothetical protein
MGERVILPRRVSRAEAALVAGMLAELGIVQLWRGKHSQERQAGRVYFARQTDLVSVLGELGDDEVLEGRAEGARVLVKIDGEAFVMTQVGR